METTVVTEERLYRTVPIDILLVAEHTDVRDGLRKLFADDNGFRVVGNASDADEAAQVLADIRPDVVIVNLSGRALPRILRQMQALTAAGSQARTILLTAALEKAQIVQAQEFGVSGIVLRDASAAVLCESVRSVAAGQRWLGHRSTSELVESRRVHNPIAKSRFGLTSRELEIVEAVLRADTNRKIASQLSISQDTVKHHLTSIFTKVGVLTRLQLAVFATRHKLTMDAGIAKESAPAFDRLGPHAPLPIDRQGRIHHSWTASQGL